MSQILTAERKLLSDSGINMAATCEKPRIIVQSDWNETLRKNNGTAWVSFRKPGCSSVYSELKTASLSVSGAPYVDAADGFSVPEITQKTLSVQYQSGSDYCQCRFISPLITFYTIHKEKKGVLCIDTTTGGLAVSCDTDSCLKVWTTQNGETRRNLEGHYGDVYTCRFFPSGVVVLSGGADTQLKIWSAETGQCAATLLGHKAGITDTAIVHRGRNIISSSRDGTAILWDVGEKSRLAVFDDVESGVINACALGDIGSSLDLGSPSQPPGEREIETGGKLLLLACENGSVQGYGLQSRTRVLSVACSGPVNCCAFVTPTAMACGTQDGHLYVYDIRNTSSPLHHQKDTRGPYLSILPHDQGFFASTGDGSCFLVSEDFSVPLELTGPDCDPVYSLATDGASIYTACRDGAVRKYKLF